MPRIRAPLHRLFFTFVEPNIPLLGDFIGLTTIPDVSHRADISFSNIRTKISLSQRNGDVDFTLEFPFSRYILAAEISFIAQSL